MRIRCLSVVLASLAAIGPAMAAQPAPTPPPQLGVPTALYADKSQPDISGLWVSTGAFYFEPNRELPKLQGEYKALYDKRMKAFDGGAPVDDVTADCLPAGMPHLLVVPYPFELVQTPGRVTFLYEYDSVVRRVPLGPAPKEIKDAPTYNGLSTGHWEGQTLVVETVNIRGDTQVDFSGVPHSDALRITERIRRKDPVTLEDTITLTDPKAYSEPFTVTREYRLRPKWKISEYVCQENNRNKTDAEGRTGFGVPKTN